MGDLFRKELILASAAGTIAVMGLAFIVPLFPIYVAEMGASNFELGLIVSGFSISQFLVQPFFGGLSDRFGRKPLMVGGLACYGLVALLYIFAGRLSTVFLVRLLQGVGSGMIWPALSAFVVDQSPAGRRGESIALLSTVEMVGFAVGPFLGGALYTLGGMHLPFLSCAVLALVATGLLWFLLEESRVQTKAGPASWRERYGFSSLKLPDVRRLCFIGLTEASVWGMIMILLPMQATKLGILPGQVGWLFSTYFLLYMLLQRPGGRWSDRGGPKRPIVIGLTIFALGVLMLSQEGTLFYLLAALALAGAGIGLYAPSIRVAIADLSAVETRGAGMGIFFTARMVGLFLGPNVSGIIADRLGYGIPFLMGAGWLALGVLTSLSLSRRFASQALSRPVFPRGK